MAKTISESSFSKPQRLCSTRYLDKVIDEEVKEIKQQQREDRMNGLSDITLMLLTMLITVLAALWLM